jgi:hypothetical protein
LRLRRLQIEFGAEMAKDVINVNGQEVVVREDTAKAYRFVHWGVITVAIGLGIMAVMFVVFFWISASDGKVESPSQFSNANSR